MLMLLVKIGVVNMIKEEFDEESYKDLEEEEDA